MSDAEFEATWGSIQVLNVAEMKNSSAPGAEVDWSKPGTERLTGTTAYVRIVDWARHYRIDPRKGPMTFEEAVKKLPDLVGPTPSVEEVAQIKENSTVAFTWQDGSTVRKVRVVYGYKSCSGATSH